MACGCGKWTAAGGGALLVVVVIVADVSFTPVAAVAAIVGGLEVPLPPTAAAAIADAAAAADAAEKAPDRERAGFCTAIICPPLADKT